MSKINIKQNFLFRFVAFIISLFFFWEVVRGFAVHVLNKPSFYFPSCALIVKSLIVLFLSSKSLLNVLLSVSNILISFACVTFLSILIGLIIGRNDIIYNLLRPTWDFLRSIPPSTLFFIFIFIFGIGVFVKISITVYYSTLILSLYIADAFHNIESLKNRAWHYIGFRKKTIIFYVYIPQVLAQLFSGLRVVSSMLIALTLIAEMYLGSSYGIGGEILFYKDNYLFPQMYSFIFVAGMIGYSINLLIDQIYSKFVRRT
jgi:ABC-type nitrate/sulfonate/bicarbonate transport system permease component